MEGFPQEGPPKVGASRASPIASVAAQQTLSLCMPHLSHSSTGPLSNHAPDVVNRQGRLMELERDAVLISCYSNPWLSDRWMARLLSK